MNAAPRFVDIEADGRRLRIEHAWLAPERADAPLMLFLHEGLGSCSLWKDFPARLCNALGCRGLVYSRPGCGRSTPRAGNEHWAPDYMHRQADRVLPALLAALDVDAEAAPIWLFGHSDGASIALLFAAWRPQQVAGAVVLAPHVTVEDLALTSIDAAREAYLHGDLRQRLARHHDDPDSVFWGWNDIWLDDAFRSWDIRAELATLRAPLLAVQGEDDEFGTLAQIHDMAARVPQAQLLVLPACRHSPHRDQPTQLIEAVRGWFSGLRR